MKIRRLVGIAAATLAMTALLVACGDSDDEKTSGNNDATEQDSAISASLTFTAHDISFGETDVKADEGKVEVTLKNEGAIEHSWVVEDRESDLRLHVEKNGDEDAGNIDLEAGDYVYYCDIPGHREAGMEGSLSVS